MRVLVTGGAGYLGYTLTNYLDKFDDISEIIVYDNLSRVHPNFFLGTSKLKKTTFIKGDILNTFELEKNLQKVDIVYHLAAHTPFPQNHLDNLRYEQINQWGTLNLVNGIKKTDTVTKVVFLSTSAIYGNRHGIQLNDSPQPQNAYSKSKYQAEKYIKTLSDQLSISIIRPGNIFGYNPCFRLDAVINNFIFESIVNKKIQIYGDGEQKRPFVHIKTLCKRLTSLMKNPHAGKQIETIADFNSSLNKIKEVILECMPSLEYIHLNQNLKFDSYSFHESMLLDKNYKDLIKQTVANFDKNIRVKGS